MGWAESNVLILVESTTTINTTAAAATVRTIFTAVRVMCYTVSSVRRVAWLDHPFSGLTSVFEVLALRSVGQVFPFQGV